MTSLPEVFSLVRTALDAAGIQYAIGGSWAGTAFGEPRFTNDVDILAELSIESTRVLLRALPDTFYADGDEAAEAIANGRPFNVIHMPTALKFDLFPASAFPLGREELDRAVSIFGTGLSDSPIPFVTPEDILLAKLHWYRLGDEASDVQRRDIQGIVKNRGADLDWEYLEQGAVKLGVSGLLSRIIHRLK